MEKENEEIIKNCSDFPCQNDFINRYRFLDHLSDYFIVPKIIYEINI